MARLFFARRGWYIQGREKGTVFLREHLGTFYDKTSDFQQSQFQSLFSLADSAAPLAVMAAKALLDIGAGTGARTAQCFDLFPALEKITAIEPDVDMLATARASYADPRIEYRQQSAAGLPDLVARGDVYDIAMSNWAMHWVPEKDDVMRHLSRLVPAGGHFMFSTCEDLPDILKTVDGYIRSEFRIQPGNSPFFYLTAGQWTALLDRHGWDIVAMEKKRIGHEVESVRRYLDHWFTASAAKFMYGRHLIDLSPLSHSDLLWLLLNMYPSEEHSEGLSFFEDGLFIVARRRGEEEA